MQNHLRELHPTIFNDLVALNALYHPGPMDYIPVFIERKKGREQITYNLPVMEKYLKETYGITVCQEQMMQMAQEIAGVSRGWSDAMRKAMGLRKKDIVDAMKTWFIEGGIKNGHDQKTLEKIWGDWYTFAPYSFCKAHAVSYTWLAYQTAYLKAHYPEEYMTAVLISRRRDEEEFLKLMRECKVLGITVSLPQINIERARRECIKNNKKRQNVLYGIQKIENGYLATKVVDQEEYEFYIVKGIYSTTAGYDVCILDSYFVDPLVANGWRYHASYGCGCLVNNGYSYSISFEKQDSKIQFEIAEDYCDQEGFDYHSVFANIMVTIANQCLTIDDVERLITEMKLPVGGLDKPIDWYKQEAEAGNVDVQIALARMYSQGLGVKEDSTKSFEWLVKAAEAGSVKSQIAVGDMCANGDGVAQDYQKALVWYTKVADAGDTDVLLKIADLHTRMSVSWYKIAAESGSKEAMEQLANFYYGTGNYIEAITWYKKLNDQGLYNNKLGHCYYEYGLYSVAIEYYAIGARNRDEESLIALGKCYSLGHGVPIDRDKANEYFAAAIEAKKAKEDLPF